MLYVRQVPVAAPEAYRLGVLAFVHLGMLQVSVLHRQHLQMLGFLRTDEIDSQIHIT
jgi:hypothetical protein